MKKTFFTIAISLFVLLIGCGELEGGEPSENMNLKEVSKYFTSKDEYLNDIDVVFQMLLYMEECDVEKCNETIEALKELHTMTKEGENIKEAIIEVMELTYEGEKYVDHVTEDNYEEIYNQSYATVERIEYLSDWIMDELLDELLIAAKEAGVEGNDIQELASKY